MRRSPSPPTATWTESFRHGDGTVAHVPLPNGELEAPPIEGGDADDVLAVDHDDDGTAELLALNGRGATDRTLQLIRSTGCKSGLVFNPATPLDILKYVMDKVDIILLMSVNPGFGGQALSRAA